MGAFGRTTQRLSIVCAIVLFIPTYGLAGESNGYAPVLVYYGPIDEERLEEVAPGESGVARSMQIDYGLVGYMIASAALKKGRDAADVATFENLKLLKVIDFPNEVSNSWGCFGLPVTARECRRIAVLGPDVSVGSFAAENVSTVSGPIKLISIDFELVASAWSKIRFHGQRKNGNLYVAEELHLMYYETPEQADRKGRANLSPRIAGETEGSNPQYSATHQERGGDQDLPPIDRWVSGNIKIVPQVLDFLYDRGIDPNGELNLDAWYKKLPKIKAMAKQRQAVCNLDYCKNRMVRMGQGNEHHWIVRRYGADLILRVVPCELLWCGENQSQQHDGNVSM